MTCSRGCALQEQLAAMQAQLAALQQTMDGLQQQLAAARKTSATSSKPPSSDLIQPPKSPLPDPAATRPHGGQPGHPLHPRSDFAPEQLTGIQQQVLPHCPTCGHDLELADTAPRRLQPVDIEAVPLRIEEHQGLASWGPQCQRLHDAPLPALIEKGGLVGPRLTVVIAFLKGACHASFSTIRQFLRAVVGVTIARGQLSKILGKVTAALEGPYEELLQQLQQAAVLNVDETGHKNNGRRWWTWCFRADLYTLFKIDPTRSGDVLHEVLGQEFAGMLGCDYYSAYRRYRRETDVVAQCCLAHLIRAARFLPTLPDAAERAYGERFGRAFQELFAVFHRRGEGGPDVERELAAARAEVLRVGTQDVPAGKHSQNLKKRLARHGESYVRFLTTPGGGTDE